jgi:hypothetical protein
MAICKDSEQGDLDAMALAPPSYDLSRTVCPTCKARASMDVHSSYHRHFTHIKDGDVVDIRIRIIRLRCASCMKTHALLPEAVVARSPFSIPFIASLIRDWLDRVFPSIEGLCAHYGIAINTFYRLKARFERSVRLAYGITSGQGGIRCALTILSGCNIYAADSLLSGYFLLAKRSFCEARGP